MLLCYCCWERKFKSPAIPHPVPLSSVRPSSSSSSSYASILQQRKRERERERESRPWKFGCFTTAWLPQKFSLSLPFMTYNLHDASPVVSEGERDGIDKMHDEKSFQANGSPGRPVNKSNSITQWNFFPPLLTMQSNILIYFFFFFFPES